MTYNYNRKKFYIGGFAMATIKPFKGYRPKAELCKDIAALPYDVMTSQEARTMVKDKPLSFLHVDRAEVDLPEDIDIYSEQVYKKAAENLNNLLKTSYVQDEKPVYYIYELTMQEHIQTGLVVCTSIDEFIDGTIKKHEMTREDKEQDRIHHVDSCNANTGPIFMAYRHEDEIDDIINKEKNKDAVYDFVSDDGIRHRVWVIDTQEIIEKLTKLFSNIDSLYIADGHHRNASAVKVGLNRRGEGTYDPSAEYNYYLSVLFPDNQLNIMEYNRVVTDLNGFTEQEFLARLRNGFNIVGCGYAYKPDQKHVFGLYMNNTWYRLALKDNILKTKEIVSNLDVAILQKYVLTPILGIVDSRTDNRITFVGGIRGVEELEKMVNHRKGKIAFSLYPTSIEDLMEVADEEKIMPPKSTWFEPKLRSGIFVHKLD